MKVVTRKGYAKNGSGREVGNNCSPQKIRMAVMAKRIEVAMPVRRTPMENPFRNTNEQKGSSPQSGDCSK